MRIKIRGEHRLTLYLPNFLLNTFIVSKIVFCDVEKAKAKEMRAGIKKTVKELKKWRKKYGKMTLVEVDTPDYQIHITF